MNQPTPEPVSRRRKPGGRLALVLLAVAGFLLAGQMHAPLLDYRRDARLNEADPLYNTTPMVAFTTIAMGGFRGIAADLLWLRASTLQSEGKYFELVQLSDWITKLEPRFPTVWAYHAWNMAYNVSVLFNRPEDRWRWVRHGISLLRDEGLRHNPHSAKLHHELGWLYQHKLGANMDNAHAYYKKAWADEMEVVLPNGRLDADAWRAGPPDREVFLQSAERAELVEQLKPYVDPFSPELLDPEGLPEAARLILEQHPSADTLQRFIRFEQLQQVYKLDPELMLELEARYGPRDWRRPQVHAMYWAFRGHRHAEHFTQVTLDRMITQSLGELFLQGSTVVDPVTGLEIVIADTEIGETAAQAFLDARKNHPDIYSFNTAEWYLLRRLLFEYYVKGEPEQAATWFERLRERNPDRTPWTSLEEAVVEVWDEMHMTPVPEMTRKAGQASAEASASLWRNLSDPKRMQGHKALGELLRKAPLPAPPPPPPDPEDLPPEMQDPHAGHNH